VKKHNIIILAVLIVLLGVMGCKRQEPQTAVQEPQHTEHDGHDHSAEQPAAPSPAAQMMTGAVVETMNSGGYTYVQLDTAQGRIWAAAPEFEVSVGETVTVPPGAPMANYHSETLDRDFDLVYFVQNVIKGEAAPAAPPQAQMPAGHPPMESGSDIDLSGIQKAEGGVTVEEIFSSQTELSGKEVIVRGKVVKFTPQIMGVNWVHLRDGTGSEGTNDLTVTTSDVVKVGDTVLVTGMATTNKDFGAGYKYDVILENAKVVAE
jgi:hypothetical protein